MMLFIRSSTNPGPRVSRISNFLSSKGNETLYLSPIRTGDRVTNDIPRLGSLGEFDYFDGSGYLAYLKFILITNIRIAKYIWIFRRKIKLVHFSDLESVITGGVLCRILRIEYIYNIHDNFFQRYDFAKSISISLWSFESVYIWLSKVTLVPESFRGQVYPKFVQPKIHVFQNFPDFDVQTDRLPFEDEEVILFYGGWISPNRNLNLYLLLAKFLVASGHKVKMLACGWGSPEYLVSLQREFAALGVKMESLGQLKQADAVDWLKKSDISVAYYSPDKIINIYAASNKMPEILGSNTLLITNSHTEIAKRISHFDISLQFESDISEIFRRLTELINDKDELIGIVRRARCYYIENYSSEMVFQRLEEIFNGYIK